MPAHADEEAAELEALSGPGIAGEILDTAVRHCQRGESAQAKAMFRAIREQLAPPAGILRVISDLEATGCLPPWIEPGTLRLHVGGGWDSNVSQGISARSLVIGNGADAIELELDESFRPRSSPYLQAAADYTMQLGNSGLRLQFGLGHRKNLRQGKFDLTTVAGNIAREYEWDAVLLRTQLDHSEVWLASRHYQHAQGASAQLVWPRVNSGGSWLASASVRRLRYVTQAAQNSVQVEAGLLREQRFSPTLAVFGGLSLQRDEATDGRPGGDRLGAELQLGGAWARAGWLFRPYVTYARWNSEDVFAPGLIDTHRRNRLVQASLQAEKPLGPRLSLLLEWRSRWARDTVTLYSYTAHSLSATLTRRF